MENHRKFFKSEAKQARYDAVFSNLAYHAYQEELARAKAAGEGEAEAQARTRVRMTAIAHEVDDMMAKNPPNRAARRRAVSQLRKGAN